MRLYPHGLLGPRIRLFAVDLATRMTVQRESGQKWPFLSNGFAVYRDRGPD